MMENMKSSEYREIIRKIHKAVLKKHLPGVKPKLAQIISNDVAKFIHARMYGANVEGVGSPLFRNILGLQEIERQPEKDTEAILNEL